MHIALYILWITNRDMYCVHCNKRVAITLLPSAAAAAAYLHQGRKCFEATSFPTGTKRTNSFWKTEIDQPVHMKSSSPEILCLDSHLTLGLFWLSKPVQTHWFTLTRRGAELSAKLLQKNAEWILVFAFFTVMSRFFSFFFFVVPSISLPWF